MTKWLKLNTEERNDILGLVSNKTGLLAYVVEKDWWVTMALYAIFRTEWKNNIVFKGGTSLSKSWGLIERFSEDIDLVLDRSVLGFGENLSKNKIKELRRASCEFTSGPFRDALETELLNLGLPKDIFELKVAETADSDRDPQILELFYKSSLEKGIYLKEAVLIEIGARSLREPSEQREITSIIEVNLGDPANFGVPFSILTVTPVRTFLEKVFLLHEEFSKPVDRIRTERMSRHLYDIDRIMDTIYGQEAIGNTELYTSIVEHRKKFNAIRNIDYNSHGPDLVNFIPPAAMMSAWEADYKAMQNDMIYGDSKSFSKIIERMEQLQQRFRNIKG